MCWHCFTWGMAVSVAEPESLRAAMAEMAKAAAQHHARLVKEPVYEPAKHSKLCGGSYERS